MPFPQLRCRTARLIWWLLATCPAPSAFSEVVQTWTLWQDGAERGRQVRTWKIAREVRPGGATADGRFLMFNSDWKAKPWAGVTFAGGSPLEITQEWYDHGFLRFLINPTVTRYHQPTGHLSFQPFLERAGGKRTNRELLRPVHIERGRGLDEDSGSWQEVLFPLHSFRDLQVGERIEGVTLQTFREAELEFGIDEVALVRLDGLPEWFVRQRNQRVLQDHVEWPPADALPAVLRADLAPPCVRDGRFVGPDGRRVFLLNPYVREVSQFDLWGNLDGDPKPPSLGLFDESRHGWIYNELLTGESLARLGFNSLSVTMAPEPWYDHLQTELRVIPADARLGGARVPPLRDLVERVRVPLHIDTVCWPWSLAKPAKEGLLPPEMVTRERHHWVYFPIIGRGRQLWLEMWALYARRYAEAGARVLTYELMNEPAYLPETPEHLAEFEDWLKLRYRSVDRLNATWQSRFHSFADAARAEDDLANPRHLGRALDYDAYMAGRFAGLIEEGVRCVNRLLPETLVGLQTMGRYVLNPRDGVWKHLLAPHETVIITPTGGGSWTSGSAATRPEQPILDRPIASAPYENDLLLALSDGKMIIDNESYLAGQSAHDTFASLWRKVIAGLDGLSVFSWNKRGWEWDQGRNKVEMIGERFPYTALNPSARRTESLRGILDFNASLQPIAAEVLAKPWGPAPKVAFIHSWEDARRRSLEPQLLDKRGAYFAALKYTHWNMAVVPSDRLIRDGALDGYEVAVLPATMFAEEELPEALESFVRQGGTLIVGEEPFSRDRYGRTIDTRNLTGCQFSGRGAEPGGEIRLPPNLCPPAMPGTVVGRLPSMAVTPGPEVEVLVRDQRNRPVITRRPLGAGYVYWQGADTVGYPLAQLLWAILLDAASRPGAAGLPSSWRAAEVIDDASGQLATNVLLSRRSHAAEGYHTLILMNMDNFPKRVRLGLEVGDGEWRVAQPVGAAGESIDGTELDGASIASGQLPVRLDPSEPNVVILQRKPAAPGAGADQLRE